MIETLTEVQSTVSGDKYLDTIQAAAELNLTVASIYKIVNSDDPNKRLNPVNRLTHKGDGGYRFTIEEIERVKPMYVKNDLTASQAAKKIGRSITYIHQLFKKGLPYYEAEFRGKRTFFIKEADLEQYAVDNPDNGKYDTIYDRKTGVYLFQPYRLDNKLARICSIKRINRQKIEAHLLIGEEEITLEQALKEGWKPDVAITDRKPITSYGYATFEFPIPATPDSFIYSIIDQFFKLTGPSNMRIEVGQVIKVEVKKSVLPGILPSTHPDIIDKLKAYVRSGEIIPKYDGTLIDTGLSPVTMYLPEEKKAAATRQAKESNVSLQEWLESIVSQQLYGK